MTVNTFNFNVIKDGTHSAAFNYIRCEDRNLRALSHLKCANRPVWNMIFNFWSRIFLTRNYTKCDILVDFQKLSVVSNDPGCAYLVVRELRT